MVCKDLVDILKTECEQKDEFLLSVWYPEIVRLGTKSGILKKHEAKKTPKSLTVKIDSSKVNQNRKNRGNVAPETSYISQKLKQKQKSRGVRQKSAEALQRCITATLSKEVDIPNPSGMTLAEFNGVYKKNKS